MEATSDGFPPKLTTKYKMSKLLQKAAGGEVRMGFRVSYWRRVAIQIICKRATTFNGGDSSSNMLNKVWIFHSYSIPD